MHESTSSHYPIIHHFAGKRGQSNCNSFFAWVCVSSLPLKLQIMPIFRWYQHIFHQNNEVPRTVFICFGVVLKSQSFETIIISSKNLQFSDSCPDLSCLRISSSPPSPALRLRRAPLVESESDEDPFSSERNSSPPNGFCPTDQPGIM